MILKTSGQISAADINVELGKPYNTQLSLNDSDVRSLAGITGNQTQIKLSDFYFKYVPLSASKFKVPGNYTFTVPPGVYQLTVSYQTTTGYTSTNLNVTPGQVIPVTIGTTGNSGSFGSINIPAYNINIVNWSGNIDDQFGVELGVTQQSYSVYLSTMRGGSGSVSYINTISVPDTAANPLEAYYSAASGRNWGNSRIDQNPTAGNGWKARAYMYDSDRSNSGYSFTLAVRQVVACSVTWSPQPTVYNIEVNSNYSGFNPIDVLVSWTNWNYTPNCQINIIIKAGVIVYAPNGSYALYSGTGWPVGTTINVINYGYIIGYGGSGGQSASYDPNTGISSPSTSGSNGGPAIGAAVAITIYNYGIISGGGGGGGSGGAIRDYYGYIITSGGGGGGGAATGTGGAAAPSYAGSSVAGGNGAMLTGGAGGSPAVDPYGGSGGSGGAGGSYGQPGVNGGSAYMSPQDQYYYYGPGYVPATAAGSAGAAINGNGNINWAVTGTIIGAIL